MRNRLAGLLGILAALVLLAMPAGPAGAQEPVVKLLLGDEGATPWSIGPIAPGQTGLKGVTIRNIGSSPGNLSIWVDNITSTDGTPNEFEEHTPDDLGELGSFLTLDVSGSGMTSDVQMPAIIDDFPHSASDSQYIRVWPLGAGETVTLNWTWELPADTGNIVQGDSISFNINYLLEEVTVPPTTPPGGGGGTSGGGGGGFGGGGFGGGGGGFMRPPQPTSQSVEIDFLGDKTERELSDEGKMLEPYIGSTSDGALTFTLAKDTAFVSEAEEPPARIVFDVRDEGVATEANQYVIGDVYTIAAFSANGSAMDLAFSPQFELVFQYKEEDTRESTTSVLFASYDEEQRRWFKIEPPADRQTVAWQVSAADGRTGTYAVIASVSMPPPVAAPARIEVHNLTISPSTVQVGQEVTVRAEAVNAGWSSGQESLTFAVSGEIRDTTVVNLAPGQRRELRYSITPAGPGDFDVQIGEAKGAFTVVGIIQKPKGIWLGAIPPLTVDGRPQLWWTLLLGLVCLSLIVMFVLGRRKNSRTALAAGPADSVGRLRQSVANLRLEHAAVAASAGMTGQSVGTPGSEHAAAGASAGATGQSVGNPGSDHSAKEASAGTTGQGVGKPVSKRAAAGASAGATGQSVGNPGSNHAAKEAAAGTTGQIVGKPSSEHAVKEPLAGTMGQSVGNPGSEHAAAAASAGITGQLVNNLAEKQAVPPVPKPAAQKPLGPVVEAITGPTRRIDGPGPYQYKIKITGGKPPYTIEWRGNRTTHTVTEAQQIELLRDQTWDSGKANWVFVVVKDSAGKYAQWLDVDGSAKHLFTYGITKKNKVITAPASFPYTVPPNDNGSGPS